MSDSRFTTPEEWVEANREYYVAELKRHFEDMRQREKRFRAMFPYAREEAPDNVRPFLDAATEASIRAWDDAKAARIASYGGRNRHERRKAAKEDRCAT